MSEPREFSTAALASLSTGVSFCNFGEVHQAAEFLMGHPIWTHHLASKDLWERMSEKVRAQHPQLPASVEGVTPENYRERLAEIEASVGKALTITRGDGSTARHPLDGIPEGKAVIVLAETPSDAARFPTAQE